MKRIHYLRCEKCGISFEAHEEAECLEHEAKCLDLMVGQHIEFTQSIEPGTCPVPLQGRVTWLHKAIDGYEMALLSVRCDTKLYEPSRPSTDPKEFEEQGRGVLVKWHQVTRILPEAA